jgi:hypothetical protein
MKTLISTRAKLIAVALLALILGSTKCMAQDFGRKDFGLGLIVGDPLGLTIKYWTNNTNAFVIDFGESDFGPTRISADYLWHFDAFQSRVVKMYIGPGAVVAFGDGNGPYGGNEFNRDDKNEGIGVRAMLGLNFIPEHTPIEIFCEAGPLIGLSPTGFGIDVAAGIRFYP